MLKQILEWQLVPKFQQKMAQGAVNIDESKFWGMTSLKREMSVSSMNLILRNTRLSKEELERFRENYRDPKAKVSFEEVIQFLAHGDGEASEEMKRLREEYEDPTAKY